MSPDKFLIHFYKIADAPNGVQRLREMILQLAVQGKLVPQDENDEPASVLLEKIQAEKERLIQEGKIKRQKPLPAITEEEKPFKLPKGWEWVRLGEISSIKGGKRLPANHNFSTVITKHIYIQVTNMKSGSIVKDNLKYISEETYQLISTYTISKDDLYITIAGTIGDVGIVPDEFDEMNLTENAAKIVFRNLDKNWLQKILSSKLLQDQFVEKVNQQAQPKLALHRVASALIPIAPEKEIPRIIAKVDALLSLCDQLEALQTQRTQLNHSTRQAVLDQLSNAQSPLDLHKAWQRLQTHLPRLFTEPQHIKGLRDAILQLAVQGKLVPQDENDEPAAVLLAKIQAEKERLIQEGKIKRQKPLPAITEEEKPFELPKGWEWVRLDSISKIITKGSSPKWQGISYTNNETDILFITSENIGSYKLILESKKYVERKFNQIEPRSILEFNDFLMNIVGGSIGRTALFNLQLEANINQAVCLIRCIKPDLYKEYLIHFFNSKTCLNYMFDKQVDNARANLSMGNISQFLIPFPPLQEIPRIIKKISSLMTLCDQLETKLTQARQTQEQFALTATTMS